MISVEKMAGKVQKALLKRQRAAHYWKSVAERRLHRIGVLRALLGKSRADRAAQARELRAFRRRQLKLPLAPPTELEG